MTELDTSSSESSDEVEEGMPERAEPPSAEVEEPTSPGADEKRSDERRSTDPLRDQGEFQQETVSWSRVGLGLTVIAALHALFTFAVVSFAFSEQVMITISVGVIPYLAGGVMLGVLSRNSERSLLDPFYAAVGPALVFPFIIELIRVSATNPPDVAQTMTRVQWLAVLAPVLVYVLVALFGCWFGEQLSPRSGRHR